MVRPLDVAWSILKLDFHMGSDSEGHFQSEPDTDHGTEYAKYASDMYGPALMTMRRRIADFPELKYQNVDEEQIRHILNTISGEPMTNEQVKHAMETLPFNSDLPHEKGPADTPNFPRPQNDKFGRYHRGGSVPRLHEDGTYVGAELNEGLAQLMGRPHPAGERAFDIGAERIANVSAHEHVHRLINDEIEQWAREQTNIEALKRQQKENIERLTQQYPPQEKFKRARKRWLKEPRTATDVLRRAGIDLDPYGDERYPETFNDMDVAQAESSFDPLRSIGHEFGAFSLTPDSSSPTGFTTPEEKIRQMGNRIYQGAEFYHPDPDLRSDLSELHLAGPSEDQVRYEQMLQEQQAAGDVNPQTSVQ